jgi:hypothetical protein
MTYQQAALAAFTTLMLAGWPVQPPTAQPPAPPQAPAPVARAGLPKAREEALLAKLKALLEPVGVAVEKPALADLRKVKRSINLVIDWDAYPDATEKMLPAEKVENRPVNKAMRLDKSERREDSLQPRYGFDLSTDKLFIAAVNAKSQLVWWEVRTDPRIVRGHTLGPNGEMAGVLYYLARVKLFISAPDGHGITEIRIFQPQWNGAGHDLEPMATVPVPN